MKFLYCLSATLAGLSFALAKTHLVSVGPYGQLVYQPPFIKAQIGDIVEFSFNPKNHTVTQSSFNHPCTKLTDQYGQPIGFDSGFQPVDPQNPETRIVLAKVWTEEPLWFYCRQTGHCGKGMVFAINPPDTGNSFEAFRDNALTTTGKVIDVTVGQNGTLAYYPSHVDANPGDEIRFTFVAKNHTVTQSSFQYPCTHLDDGFDTGFEFVGTSNNTIIRSVFVPNTTEPLWFYCRQKVPTSHCGQGMVFAINAPKTGNNTFEAFQQRAIASGGY